MAYIYPDYRSVTLRIANELQTQCFRTALVGKFTRGEMEAGREARLTGLEEDEHGVKIPVLRRTDEDSDHVHRRQIGQFNFICKGGLGKLRGGLSLIKSSLSRPTCT